MVELLVRNTLVINSYANDIDDMVNSPIGLQITRYLYLTMCLCIPRVNVVITELHKWIVIRINKPSICTVLYYRKAC